MRKHTVKGFLWGVIATCSILVIPKINAADLQETIRVTFTNMPLYVEGKLAQFTKKPFIYEGTTYVPIRTAAETLGKEVYYDAKKHQAYIFDKNGTNIPQGYQQNNIPAPKVEEQPVKSTSKEFVLQGISIGDGKAKVLETLGEPARKDLSEYGFEWYIYNQDYAKYIQVGISGEKVVGLYTNTGNWKSQKGIQIGTPRREVVQALGTPLDSILKDNTRYFLGHAENEAGLYLIGDVYTTIFYDIHEGDAVTAIQLIDREAEMGHRRFYGTPSEALGVSFEKQVFDLANAIRVRYQMEPFQWDELAAQAARAHSKDMAVNGYFDHVNLRGESPFQRMEAAGVSYRLAAENIAAGQTSAIFAHEGWMNSAGHRKNILGNTKRLGVGVYFGGNMHVQYTQNFYTPLR